MTKPHFGAMVILETMWDWCGLEKRRYGAQGPPYFEINPDNNSGRRLYTLLGDITFRVTNACPEVVDHHSKHGKPDPAWLASNLQRATYDLLLVCGKVARSTYIGCGYQPQCPVLVLKHPAARDWKKEEILRWQKIIRSKYDAYKVCKG